MEILVVIGIMAVLTAIILPSLNNIRAKNRDTERIADIGAIQLGLLLYKSHNNQYPADLQTLLSNNYVTSDSITAPTVDSAYQYVPLSKSGSFPCTYYHLGTKLELTNGQIDIADNFSSLKDSISNGYVYCGGYSGPGISSSNADNTVYEVHP